jgi:hypothetical protein
MTKHLKILLLFAFICCASVQAQTKMVVGEKHTIFADIPKNWAQAPHPQLPLFIKPVDPNVSQQDYMYVYGLDYEDDAELDKWLDGNNDYLKEQYPGIVIEALKLNLDNIKKSDYQTGRYAIVTYTYPNGKKEALLIIECIHTIATVLMAAENSKEFDKYLPAFTALSKSIKVMGTTLKKE